MANVSGDWLSVDPRDPETEINAKERARAAAVERAQPYRAAFVDSPAGRALLAQWDSEIKNVRVSVNATLSEYVAAETVRNFVQKIHDQIKIATMEGRS